MHLFAAATDNFLWLVLQADVTFALAMTAVAQLGITRLPRERKYLTKQSVLVPATGIRRSVIASGIYVLLESFAVTPY